MLQVTPFYTAVMDRQECSFEAINQQSRVKFYSFFLKLLVSAIFIITRTYFIASFQACFFA